LNFHKLKKLKGLGNLLSEQQLGKEFVLGCFIKLLPTSIKEAIY